MAKRIAKRLEEQIKGTFTWTKNQITQHPYLTIITVGALCLAVYLLYARFGAGLVGWADWTGFGEYTSPNGEYRLAKTLWDWLSLLIIPVVLAVGAWALNKTEREAEREAAEKRAAIDREIALDRQRQATLQSYYDRMTKLLLEEGLLKSSEDEPVRAVARTITLTTLRSLDGERKGLVVQFLHEADLLNGTLDLRGADLSEADLRAAVLSGANLRWTRLSGANLRWANLTEAHLNGADLHRANLSEANLVEAKLQLANLSEADLRWADLRWADLSLTHLNKADLNGARLHKTDLTGAVLSETDLSKVDLSAAMYNTHTKWPKGFDPKQSRAISE